MELESVTHFSLSDLRAIIKRTLELDFLRPCVPLFDKQTKVTLKGSPHLLILIVALIDIFVSKGLDA